MRQPALHSQQSDKAIRVGSSIQEWLGRTVNTLEDQDLKMPLKFTLVS